MANEAIRRVIEIDIKESADAASAIKAIQQNLKNLEDSASSAKKVLGSSLVSVAAFGVVKEGFNAIKESIVGVIEQAKGISEIQAGLERLRLGFASIDPKGLQGAAESIEFVRAASRNLGIDFQSAATSYLKLAASTRGTNVEGARTKEIFEGVSLAASRLGLSTATTENAFRALQQMISKGVVQQEELRGQLSEALPGAIQIFARALGVSVIKLNEMVKAGELGSEAVVLFANQLKKEFGGQIPEGVNTSILAIAAFDNALLQLKQTITDSSFGKAAASVLQGAAAIFDDITDSIKRSTNASDNFLVALFKTVRGVGLANEARERSIRLAGLESAISPDGKRNVEGRPLSERQLAELASLKKQVAEDIATRNAQDAKTAPPVYTNTFEGDANKNLDLNAKLASSYGRLTKEYVDHNAAKAVEIRDIKALFSSGFLERELGSREKAVAEYDRLIAATTKKNDKQTEGQKLDAKQIEDAKRIGVSLDEQIAALRTLGNEESSSAKIAKTRSEINEKYIESRTREAKIGFALDLAKLQTLELEQKTVAAKQNAIKADKEYNDGLVKDNAALIGNTQSLRDSLELIGLSTDAQKELLAVKEERKAADLELQLMSEVDNVRDSTAIDLLREKIKLLKENAGAIRDVVAKEKEQEMQDFIKKKLPEKEKAREDKQVEDITSSLVNSFKKDKDIGKAVYTTIRDSLRERVFKLTIEPQLNEFAKAINKVIESTAQYINKVIGDALSSSSSGGGFGQWAGFLTKFFGGTSSGTSSGGSSFGEVVPADFGHAAGGTLGAGKYGVAGEHGPELIYGGTTGMTIQPSSASSKSSSQGSNVTVNIIGAPEGTKTNERETPDGRLIEVMIGHARDAVASDIASGGRVSSAIQGAFGVSRATPRVGF